MAYILYLATFLRILVILFSGFLADISGAVSGLNSSLFIAGDFNARSVLWGSHTTDRRGELTERWAAALGINLLNVGGVYTCVRPQGSSIVDLSWVSPELVERVSKWSVLETIETLSDHLYIEIRLTRSASMRIHIRDRKRWNIKKLDEELFNHIIEFQLTAEIPGICHENPEEFAKWIVGIVRNACNASAPVVSGTIKKKQAYWWSDKIARLRAVTIKARRAWTRCKRKNDNVLSHSKKISYDLAKKELRRAIRKAKDEAWRELISTINKDPWGLPYKLVMGKLRVASPSFSETLDEDSLINLIDSLFPTGSCYSNINRENFPSLEWVEEMDVGVTEVSKYVKKRVAKNTAPGPDNIKSSVWKKVPGILLICMADMFTLCFKTGIFPRIWKRAALVLIPKNIADLTSAVKARPICLLDELGKTLERIIAARIND